MTLSEIKQLNITISREVSFALMDDISENDLDVFLNEFIPENYNKSWEEMSEEEIQDALREFNYSDYYDLDELLDDMSEIEVNIWKKKEIRKVLVLRGLQGSGKSTFAKQWVNEDPEHRVRFNQDDVRNMLGKYWVPRRETLINVIYDSFLTGAMTKGYNIVIDNMNLNEKYLKDIQEDIDRFNNTTNDDYEIKWCYEMEVKDFFHIPLQVCIERDAQRENPIGAEVIKRTYNKYKDKIIPWRYLN